MKTNTTTTDKDSQLKNLKLQESKALAKLEKIKSWPTQDHKQPAIDRTQATLNQIRERMKALESTPKPT